MSGTPQRLSVPKAQSHSLTLSLSLVHPPKNTCLLKSSASPSWCLHPPSLSPTVPGGRKKSTNDAPGLCRRDRRTGRGCGNNPVPASMAMPEKERDRVRVRVKQPNPFDLEKERQHAPPPHTRHTLGRFLLPRALEDPEKSPARVRRHRLEDEVVRALSLPRELRETP